MVPAAFVRFYLVLQGASIPTSKTDMHPLDPLSQSEIQATSTMIKNSDQAKSLGKVLFNSISLLEPPKQEYLDFVDSIKGKPARKSLSILMHNGSVYEAVVQLEPKLFLESWRKAPEGHQPNLSSDEYINVQKIALSDKGVQDALKKLEIPIDKVAAEPWTIGYREEYMGKRMCQVFLYYEDQPYDNFYAHPIDIWPIIDLGEEKVAEIQRLPDRLHPGKLGRNSNYSAKFAKQEPGSFTYPPSIPPLLPIKITQPSGPSFLVKGNEISWYKWNFRISFNYREGLVLHDVCWLDVQPEKVTDPILSVPRKRRILYRASIAEMVVPYCDPRGLLTALILDPYPTKCAFDAGCDCVGDITYFDGVLNNGNGDAVVIENAICMHEEDIGMLFKHTNFRDGHAESRRNRRLVVSFVATVVNYEFVLDAKSRYAFYWYFYLDGTIKCEIKATGIISTAPLPSNPEEFKDYGIRCDDIFSTHHQHLFSARLDFMIDTLPCTVSELEAVRDPPSEKNPCGNGFTIRETNFKTHKEAIRDARSQKGVFWKITANNAEKSAWKLVPQNTVDLLCTVGSRPYLHSRGYFTTHSLFVTKFAERELYPSGFYVNQLPGGHDGLAIWSKRDEPIENQDVVLWHTFGVTHVPRPEDWPIMNVEMCGFSVKPCGFFKRNPALDIPESLGKSENVERKGACCS